jgi:serine/threonine protein kinase
LKVALGREFQILVSLRHPHIISVLDYGFDADHMPYLTLEYLPDAQDLLQVGASSSVQEKVHFLMDVLQALHYLHRRDVLHLDLKPGNILVSGGRLRVLDFGLAQVASPEGAVAPQSGTLFYMAPKVLQAARDPRAGEFLTTAHTLLQEQAAKITDDDLRRSFLENVPAHREIGNEFHRAFGSE